MIKFETNLWKFLAQKTFLNFNLLDRLNMAINLALEVEKMSGDEYIKTAHRDLEPSNVMLDTTGNLCLIDVGIGRTFDVYRNQLAWGSSGTPGFLAPEQFTCARQTEKVDIWALGKIIALIIFQWDIAWQLLWSPKLLEPNDITSLGSLVILIDLLKDMLEVSYHYTKCHLTDILLLTQIPT